MKRLNQALTPLVFVLSLTASAPSMSHDNGCDGNWVSQCKELDRTSNPTCQGYRMNGTKAISCHQPDTAAQCYSAGHKNCTDMSYSGAGGACEKKGCNESLAQKDNRKASGG
jgi:hypothetical protein